MKELEREEGKKENNKTQKYRLDTFISELAKIQKIYKIHIDHHAEFFSIVKDTDTGKKLGFFYDDGYFDAEENY